jgi:heme/copper-type cytochrome/quinol oxidase subunit 4
MRVWLDAHPRWMAVVQGVLTAVLFLVINAAFGGRVSVLRVIASLIVFPAVVLTVQLFRERNR